MASRRPGHQSELVRIHGDRAGTADPRVAVAHQDLGMANSFEVAPSLQRADSGASADKVRVGGRGDPLKVLSSQVTVLSLQLAELRRAPRAFWLATLGAPGYRLRLPVPVELSEDEGVVAAHATDFEVYGAGDSEYEALADLRRVIIDEYDSLLASEAELGHLLVVRLARYREVIEQVK